MKRILAMILSLTILGTGANVFAQNDTEYINDTFDGIVDEIRPEGWSANAASTYPGSQFAVRGNRMRAFYVGRNITSLQLVRNLGEITNKILLSYEVEFGELNDVPLPYFPQITGEKDGKKTGVGILKIGSDKSISVISGNENKKLPFEIADGDRVKFGFIVDLENATYDLYVLNEVGENCVMKGLSTVKQGIENVTDIYFYMGASENNTELYIDNLLLTDFNEERFKAFEEYFTYNDKAEILNLVIDEIRYEDVILKIGSSNAVINHAISPIEEGKDVKPFIYNGTTMVPLRFLCEHYGATVSYNPGNNNVFVQYKNNLLKINLKTNDVKLNGEKYFGKILVESGRTLVPIRLISSVLDREVLWHNDGNIVITRGFDVFERPGFAENVSLLLGE